MSSDYTKMDPEDYYHPVVKPFQVSDIGCGKYFTQD